MTHVKVWPVVGALLGTLAWIGSPQQDAQAHPRVWRSTGPPATGVTAIVIDPQKQGTLYAAAWGAGIYKSSNGGVNWRSTSTGLSSREISTLVIDPQTPTTVYAGTDSRLTGVFRSTDGGETWKAINSGLAVDGTPWQNVRSLAIDPRNPKILYAAAKAWSATRPVVFKSIDGGDTWSEAGTGFRSQLVLDLAIDPQTPTIIYAATWGGKFSNSGIYRSTDGGASWGFFNSGLPYSSSHALYPPYLTLTINAEQPSTLYLGTTDDGVFKSTDGGGTWKAVNSGLPRHPFESRYPTIAAVELDPTHPNVVYAGLEHLGLFKSLDGGESWIPVNYGSTVQLIAVDPSNNGALYVVGPHGIFKSTDNGTQWVDSNVGLGSSAHVVALATDPANPGAVYAGIESPNHPRDLDRGDGTWRPAGQLGAGVFKSTDRGDAWSGAGLSGFPILSIAIDPNTPTTIYASTWGGGFFKSTDEGISWDLLNWIDWDVTTIAIDPDTSFVYAGTSGVGIYKSQDGGASWHAVNVGLGAAAHNTNSLFFDPSNPLTLYAGSFYGGVFKSTNGGSNWSPANTGLTFFSGPYQGNQEINTLAIDPRTPTTLYAGAWYSGGGYVGGVFRSDDGGDHWSAVSNGLDSISSRMVHALAIDPRNPAILYAGTEEGVFTSSDRGAHWSALDAGLTGFAVKALVIDPRPPGAIYAGTRYGGVFVMSPAPLRDDDVKASSDDSEISRSQLSVGKRAN